MTAAAVHPSDPGNAALCGRPSATRRPAPSAVRSPAADDVGKLIPRTTIRVFPEDVVDGLGQPDGLVCVAGLSHDGLRRIDPRLRTHGSLLRSAGRACRCWPLRRRSPARACPTIRDHNPISRVGSFNPGLCSLVGIDADGTVLGVGCVDRTATWSADGGPDDSRPSCRQFARPVGSERPPSGHSCRGFQASGDTARGASNVSAIAFQSTNLKLVADGSPLRSLRSSL